MFLFFLIQATFKVIFDTWD